jgi:SAM-dependent methyltransferase
MMRDQGTGRASQLSHPRDDQFPARTAGLASRIFRDHGSATSASMVLPVIPDWAGAMRACVQALKPGGLFVFTVNHPCFEQLWPAWREHGEYRTRRYLAEYEIPGPSGTDFHRTLSAYLNQLISLGCHINELAEPGLDPADAAGGPEGIDAYVHLPNFLVVAARRTD